MTTENPRPDPRAPREPDDDLRALVADAVAGVEPVDRLAEIRAATTRRRRRTWLTVGGSAVLAAAVVVAVAVVVDRRDDDRPDSAAPPPTATSTAPQELTSPGVEEQSTDDDVPSGVTAVYYVGDGPDGPDAPAEVLYRSFEPAGDPLQLLVAAPADPDYRTLWPAGSLVSWESDGDRIVVTVAGGPVDDELARQQLAYTVQASVGAILPVALQWDDGRTEPIPDVERAPELEVLSHMSISDPAEGASYAGSFVARGRANGFEGTVFCQLLDDAGEPVWERATVNGGLLDETLNPWELRVGLGRVEPGTYTFRCQTDDPTAGTEGRGADVDTRTVTVE